MLAKMCLCPTLNSSLSFPPYEAERGVGVLLLSDIPTGRSLPCETSQNVGETETVFTCVRQVGAEAGGSVKQGEPLFSTGTDPETRRHCINSMEELGWGTECTVLPWSAGGSFFVGLWNITLK